MRRECPLRYFDRLKPPACLRPSSAGRLQLLMSALGPGVAKALTVLNVCFPTRSCLERAPARRPLWRGSARLAKRPQWAPTSRDLGWAGSGLAALRNRNFAADIRGCIALRHVSTQSGLCKILDWRSDTRFPALGCALEVAYALFKSHLSLSHLGA
jgi:hypothetical protein